MTTTENDLIYAAATIDCEGSIAILKSLSSHGKGKYSLLRLVVQVGMTTETVPRWLHAKFGGGLGCYQPSYPTHKLVYHWHINSYKAVDFIRCILPYLKLKSPQAELALAFQDTKEHYHSNVTPPVMVEVQEMMRTKMRELNGRVEA